MDPEREKNTSSNTMLSYAYSRENKNHLFAQGVYEERRPRCVPETFPWCDISSILRSLNVIPKIPTQPVQS